MLLLIPLLPFIKVSRYHFHFTLFVAVLPGHWCHHLCVHIPLLPSLSVTSHLLPPTPGFTAGYKSAVVFKRPLVTLPSSVSSYSHHFLIAIIPWQPSLLDSHPTLTACLSCSPTTIFLFIQTTPHQKLPAKVCDNPLLHCGHIECHHTIQVNFC